MPKTADDTRQKSGYRPRRQGGPLDGLDLDKEANKIITKALTDPETDQEFALQKVIITDHLKSGPKKDPREQFTNLSFDELAKKICRLGVTLHPDYRTLEGIEDHLWRNDIPCPLMTEGNINFKKKDEPGDGIKTT